MSVNMTKEEAREAWDKAAIKKYRVIAEVEKECEDAREAYLEAVERELNEKFLTHIPKTLIK